MTAYEFYWVDGRRGVHFLTILPEKRKNPERITKESIMNWGRRVMSSNGDAKNIYFINVEIPETLENNTK